MMKADRARLLGITGALCVVVVGALVVLTSGNDRVSLADTFPDQDPAATPAVETPLTPLEREPIVPPDAQPEEAAGDEIVFPPFPPLDGPGWRICGRITGIFEPGVPGRPLAGARVTVLFSGDSRGHTPWVSVATSPVFTNESGLYAVSVTAPDWAQSPGHAVFEVCVCARAAAHEPWSEGIQDIPAPHGDPEPVRFDIRLWPGANMHASVVFPDGSPVPGADVFARPPGGEWGAERVAFSIEDGSAAGEVLSHDPIEIAAAAAGAGCSPVLLVTPSEDAKEPWPELVVEQGGVVAGAAVDPEGTPLPDLWIDAYPIELVSASEEDLDVFEPRRSEALRNYLLPRTSGRPGTGLRTAYNVTDAKGAFRIAGLQPGKYFLRVHGGAWCFEPGREPRVPCSTGDASVLVEVPLHRLRLAVIDEDDRPVKHGLVILQRERHGESLRSKRAFKNGSVVHPVTPGVVEVKGLGPLGRSGAAELVYPAGVFEYAAELRITPQPEARLEIFLTYGDRPSRSEHLSPVVWLHGTWEEAYRRMTPEPDPSLSDAFVLGVPPGLADIQVWPGGPGSDALIFWGSVRPESGATTTLVVPVQMGGRIRISEELAAEWEESGARRFSLGSWGPWDRDYIGDLRLGSDRLLEHRAGYHPGCPWTEIFQPGEYSAKRFPAHPGDKSPNVEFAVEPGRTADLVLP